MINVYSITCLFMNVYDVFRSRFSQDPKAKVTRPTVTVLPPSPKEICNVTKPDEKVTLVCAVTNFYPDHVTVSWKINDQEVTAGDQNITTGDRNVTTGEQKVVTGDQKVVAGVGTDESPLQNKETLMYSITSRLRVLKSDWRNTTYSFTCSVQFFDGTDYVTVTDTIQGQHGECDM